VGMLSATLILAIMVIPFSSSVAREILKNVPAAQREAAYALGATRWEAIKVAVGYGKTGIIGAIMLGLGRALGETMAVTMVIGNNPQVTTSLFAPQYTMAAVIANEFTEAADELYLHALILIAIAALFAVPIGCICGIHLAEYRDQRFSSVVRFAADVLNGVPSIVIGIFAYGLAVLPVKRFSAIAGGFALGLLMIPVVV